MIKFQLPFQNKTPPIPVSVLGLKKLKGKNKKLSRRKIITALTGFLLITVIFGIFLTIKNNPFQIKNVVFKTAGLSCVSNEQLENELQLSKYNFFNLNQKKLEQETRNKFTCISFINLKRKIPSTIEINAQDRKIAAQVKVYQIPEIDLNLEEATSSTQAAQIVDNVSKAQEAGSFIVDTDGVAVNLKTDTAYLPLIEYYNQNGEIKVGTKLPNDVIPKTLEILIGLNEQSLNYENLKIIEGGLYVKGEKEIVFSLEKEIKRQLAYLQLILHQATIDAKVVGKIDLRFDKAIVVYK